MAQPVTRSRRTFAVWALVACTQVDAPAQRSAEAAHSDGSNVASAPNPGARTGADRVSDTEWTNIQISDVYTRDAAKSALRGASRWLARPKCQMLFQEFRDNRQQPLTVKLAELAADPERYLHMVLFLDGAKAPACQRHGILAFTSPGARVIYLCGREFERGWRRDAREIQATIIHELLHSLGLGENPPSPRRITDRVQRLCWH